MISPNKIFWVFSSAYPDNIPSYVVSGILPANFLGIKKVIFLKEHNPRKFLKLYKPRLLIVGKAFHIGIANLLKEAKSQNIKIISIFDDWYFSEENSYEIDKSKFNTLIANYSDKIVVKTSTAANLIKNKINITAKTIPDCLRFKYHASIQKINYPFQIAWFGMWTNHDTLIFGLNQITKYNYDVDLNIITNKIDELKKKLSKINLKKISIKFTEWTPTMDEKLKKTDIIIIPYINDSKRLVKSFNRITDAMNLGKFVIISKIPSVLQFMNYSFLGNMGEGLDWIKHNNDLAIKKAKEGNKYVKNNFGIKKNYHTVDKFNSRNIGINK